MLTFLTTAIWIKNPFDISLSTFSYSWPASNLLRKKTPPNMNITIIEGVESDPHQKMIYVGKSEIDRHTRKVIHIPIGKVITIYY